MHWLFAILTMMLVGSNGAREPVRAPQAWDPYTIQWQEVAADGTKYSLLEGRRDIPGQAFTYAFFIPAGYHEHHWHTADARVAVVQGALKISFGDRLDLDHMQTYSSGAFLLVPANVKHTMAADVDTIIIGTAIGPWATHHNGEEHHQH